MDMLYFSICVIFDFFHQHLAVFRVQVFCLLRLVYSWTFYSFFKNNFIYLLLAVLVLHCCIGFSLVVESRGYSLGEVYSGLLTVVASPVAEHGL